MSSLHQRFANVNGASFSGSIDPNDDIVHFCHVAALIVTVYDHLITLDYEVEYIWKKKWSKSKLLYILARYFGDMLLISICVGKWTKIVVIGGTGSVILQLVFLNREASYMVSAVGLKFVGTGSMVIIIITQMIMQLRIKALYGTMISNFITTIWVMEVTAVVSLGIASLAAIDVHPVILATTTMCNPTYLPRFAFLFWVPVIVFESFLFSLALRIAYQNYKEIGTWRGTSLLYIVLRDNFSFFVCAFALYIITATTWLTADPRYFTVPGSFSCSLTTIMGSRLILNLCEAYHHPPDPNATPPASIWAAATSGNIQFLGAPRRRRARGGDGGGSGRAVSSKYTDSDSEWARGSGGGAWSGSAGKTSKTTTTTTASGVPAVEEALEAHEMIGLEARKKEEGDEGHVIGGSSSTPL